jgi:large-conductance mechanosensitive channel
METEAHLILIATIVNSIIISYLIYGVMRLNDEVAKKASKEQTKEKKEVKIVLFKLLENYYADQGDYENANKCKSALKYLIY